MTDENIETMSRIFRAIERRDQKTLAELFHPEVEFHWAPSLPYGKNPHDRPSEGTTWAQTWMPLQPTAAERSMDPRVVAANGDEVVVLWRQRGVTTAGDRVDVPVLGLYRLREGKLVRAEMFDFDGAGLVAFVTKARA
jgi:ketosteroid isomerase-like protein